MEINTRTFDGIQQPHGPHHIYGCFSFSSLLDLWNFCNFRIKILGVTCACTASIPIPFLYNRTYINFFFALKTITNNFFLIYFFVMVNLSVLLPTAGVHSGVTRLLLTSILSLERLMGGLMYLLLVWDLQLQRMNFWS